MSVREKLSGTELDWTEEATPEWLNRWTALAALTFLYTLVGTAALQTPLV